MSTTEAARQELSAGFEGEVISQEDSGYDEARALFNAMIDKRPLLIARCASGDDVARAIAFAKTHDVPLAIRGAGHNGGGLGSVDDGVVADLSLLRSVSVDSESRTVKVGGGCTWNEVDVATHEHGTGGAVRIISTTGRRPDSAAASDTDAWYGLTIDNLLAAQVVLADGSRSPPAPTKTRTCSGRCARGGNFGVVTEFYFPSAPVSDVVGGPTLWPLEQTDEVLSRIASSCRLFPAMRPGSSRSTPCRRALRSRRRSTCGKRAWSSGIVGSDEEAGAGDGPDAGRRHAAHARRRARRCPA
jgi:FAD/FMN-containing dehydrogenase